MAKLSVSKEAIGTMWDIWHRVESMDRERKRNYYPRLINDDYLDDLYLHLLSNLENEYFLSAMDACCDDYLVETLRESMRVGVGVYTDTSRPLMMALRRRGYDLPPLAIGRGLTHMGKMRMCRLDLLGRNVATLDEILIDIFIEEAESGVEDRYINSKIGYLDYVSRHNKEEYRTQYDEVIYHYGPRFTTKSLRVLLKLLKSPGIYWRKRLSLSRWD